MKKHDIVVLIGIVAALYGVAVITHAHTLLFSESVGYLYHPSSDRLFRLRLGPSPFDSAELFNPLSQVLYDDIIGAEELGRLADILAEQARDLQLLRTDQQAWRAKLEAEIQESIASAKRTLELGPDFDLLIEFPQAGRFRSAPLPAALPAELDPIRPFALGDTPGVMLGDAVHVRIRPDRPTETEFLEGVVFVRDPRAAGLISQIVP